jgi:hypothetical protein
MNRLFSGTITLLLSASLFSAFSQESPVGNSPELSVDSEKGNNSKDSLIAKEAPDTTTKAVSGNQVPVLNSATQTGPDTSLQNKTVLPASNQQADDLKIDSSASTSVPVTTVLQISSVPPGAAVLLNDSVLGVTPVTVNSVVPGNYSLVFKMKGYYQKKTEITVAAKDTQRINLELLKPAMVTYLSKPEGVAVTANGKSRGVTPFTDSLVKPGNYLIQGTLDRYEVVLKNVSIANGATDTVLLELLKPGEKKKPVQQSSEKEIRPLKRYSGIIGAAAFAIFAFVLLLAERDNL